ncbi:MAG: NAD-dependent epimerase/dehydratase family protein [Candidatus Micrarchaeota archaeon]
MTRILVTGALGLVGSDLVPELQKKYGKDNVIASDYRNMPREFNGITEKLDVRDAEAMKGLIRRYDLTQIYHLAGLMSAGGEKNPNLAWDINITGIKNVLDLSVEHNIRVFWPSSIAVFGPNTPRDNTPQHTIIEPTTIYGVTKLAGELLCQYYFLKHGLDVRSLRYPGLVGYKAPPGDGTTEYAIWVFYGAIRKKRYTCFLKEDTVLPMMYMDDAIKGTIDIMDAKNEDIRIRTSYNFSAISFCPKDIYVEIKKLVPDFEMDYKPDGRQKIAESWPTIIDDSEARKDWNWKPDHDLKTMTKDMYEKLSEKLKSRSAEI